MGIIASEAPAYKIVTGFLLPLAVPLLLFRADMRRVLKSTGTLLMAFLLGSGNGLLHIFRTTYGISAGMISSNFILGIAETIIRSLILKSYVLYSRFKLVNIWLQIYVTIILSAGHVHNGLSSQWFSAKVHRLVYSLLQ